MNRLALTLAFGFAAFGALAQAPFTIVRPADGAKVRETIKLLIPRASVVPGGYVGIFIGGKFVEARSADPLETKTPGKYFEYDLDTKAKHIPDGKLTLEAVLYVDYESKPRIVNRTSVEVTVANTADNKIPEKGLLLRYKWTPGTEMIYDFSAREITDISDSKKNALGARPDEQSQNLMKFRLLYAVDNAYPDGSGLVRVQPLPDKKSDSVFVPTSLAPEGQRVYSDQMTPVYLHLSSTGLESWGSLPFALALEGTSGNYSAVDFFTAEPLPTLPYDPVKVGGPSWLSRFQDQNFPDEADRLTSNKFVERVPARGEFKGVEWEMGHPCARIVNTLELGVKTKESKKLETAGRTFTGNKLAQEETIWFALDKRQIIKIVRTITFDQQVAVGNNGMGGGPNGNPGPPEGGDRGAGSRMRNNGDENMPPPTLPDLRQGVGLSPGGNKGRLGNNGPGGTPRGGPGRGTGAPATAVFVRTTLEETFILEQ